MEYSECTRADLFRHDNMQRTGEAAYLDRSHAQVITINLNGLGRVDLYTGMCDLPMLKRLHPKSAANIISNELHDELEVHTPEDKYVEQAVFDVDHG